MPVTRYYSWTSNDTKAALFVADDDPAYARVSFLTEAASLELWIRQWTTFQGFAVLVLDSEIRTATPRSPTPIREPDLIEWCNAKKLFNSGVVPGNRTAVVLSGGGGVVKSPVKRWYVKSEQVEVSLNAIRELAIRTATESYGIDSWPSQLADSKAVISQVIHRLQNLFLPFTLDVKTLGEEEAKSKEVGATGVEAKHAMWEIIKDYFGEAEDGYLGHKSQQHDGTNFINCVQKHCTGLPPDVQGHTKVLVQQLQHNVEAACDWGKQRRANAADVGFPEELHKQLTAVATAGEAIIEQLRKTRKV